MFISFYKLLFLGTEFAYKMLKIKVIEAKDDEPLQIILNDGTKTDEESKLSDNNFFNGTSDILSDHYANEAQQPNHEGSVQATEKDPDPYYKVKLHACLSL